MLDQLGLVGDFVIQEDNFVEKGNAENVEKGVVVEESGGEENSDILDFLDIADGFVIVDQVDVTIPVTV